ncbi:hypothetical protein D7Y23_04375 [Corallococcus sp. AB050B]|nr:hypothetical protein D7Y23_04375 [Corallococcus sp. AB050B]
MGRGLPRYVERDFARYLEGGVLIAFSCKGRGVCPSCNANLLLHGGCAGQAPPLVLPVRVFVRKDARGCGS